MNLSQETLDVLKNISGIVSHLHISPGNEIRALSDGSKQILAIANVPDEFPMEFAIYDLGKFLSVIRTFDNPDLDFQEKYVVISEGKTKVRYIYAGLSAVPQAPESFPPIPEPSIEFEIDEKILQATMQAASILKLPDITIRNSGGELELVARDKSRTENGNSQDSNEHVTSLGASPVDSPFKADFVASNLSKIMATKYDAKLGFKNRNSVLLCLDGGSLKYGIAGEKTSDYGSDV